MQKQPSTSAQAALFPTPASDNHATLAAVLAAQPDGVYPVRLDKMLESLRYAEYDIAHGIGEGVDNSVEAGARNISVFVDTEKRLFKGRNLEVVSAVAIVDDGEGMSPDVLHRCLVLGESLRTHRPGASRGIGRFGVGMTLGAISLGRRVEVYSRQRPADPFLYTYIDLTEIQERRQTVIPTPIALEPPPQYTKLLADSSGTVLVISDCDRLQTDPVEKEKGIAALEQLKPLMGFLGRTYRKYIDAGRHFRFNGEPVLVHDPLYQMGPTFPEHKAGKPDPKAISRGEDEITLDVPGQPGQTATVKLRITLLPKEWRLTEGSGASALAKERKIPDNEGISILRADREVLYGAVPYILGPKGQAAAMRIDRWWGLEISFPPELDDYFHVRYIKRGAEPVTSLRDQIREKIWRSIETLRTEIQRDMREARSDQIKKAGFFVEAEQTMNSADSKLPKGKVGTGLTETEAEEQFNRVIEEDAAGFSEDEKTTKKEELKRKPYAIVPVRDAKNVFFETEHILGRIIVKLNVQHPFYKDVFEPLCGSVVGMTEDSDENEGADTEEKQRARRAFLVLILSYAKAESFFEGAEQRQLIGNLRSYWGISLATALNG